MPGFNITGASSGGSTDPSNTVETTRKHRFLIKLFNPLSTDLLWFAKKVIVPGVEIDRIVFHHRQEEIYLPGKHRYGSCEITFYRTHDTNGDRAARELYNWWSSTLLNVNQSSLQADSTTGSVVKRNGEIDVLDGAGNVAYKYNIYGAWPQKMTPDSLDASENGIAEITCIFLVDKVKEQTGTSGTGAISMCSPAGAGGGGGGGSGSGSSSTGGSS